MNENTSPNTIIAREMNDEMNTQMDTILRKTNLLDLLNAIENGSVEGLIRPTEGWGGANVLIATSKEELLSPPRSYNFERYAHSDTLVFTKHSAILSGFFYYIKNNVMYGRDFYLYGFMALLANDYLKQKGDSDDYIPLLSYVAKGVKAYLYLFNWEDGAYHREEFYHFLKTYLSDNMSDEEIKKIF